jgi:hypothetical protein
MTKLLKEAVDRLNRLPEPIQDTAARALILQLEEELEPSDHFDESSREARLPSRPRGPRQV